MNAQEARASTLARIREIVKDLFATKADCRSALFSVARTDDDDDDDVRRARANIILSARRVPRWPHECREDDVLQAGNDSCSRCDPERIVGPVIGGAEWEWYWGAGDDFETVSEGYAPYALFRRRDDGELDVEIVGRAKPGYWDRRSGPMAWPDERAHALFELVCAHPDDVGPRTVLADYLMEKRDPRGEYIALALAADLDAAGRARRDELLATHERAWMAPLDGIIPPGCARFERGFLVYAAVEGAIPPDVARSPMWGTVETLRNVGRSDLVITAAMSALRDLGPVGVDGLGDVLRTEQPWRIERLHVALSPTALAKTNVLPALRHLVMHTEFLTALGPLSNAAWWAQIERVTVLGPVSDLARVQTIQGGVEPLPELAISEHEDRRPCGWEVVFSAHGVQIGVVGFAGGATFEHVVEQLGCLPREKPITAMSSSYFTFEPEDIALLEAAGHVVTAK